VSGNVEFPATVDVVVQENTATNMKEMMSPPGMGKPGSNKPTIFDQHQGTGLPKRTFMDRMTLFKGPDQIDLYYFGRGHTNGDAWVLFPAARVVATGDIVPGKRVPIVDSNNGGSGVEYGDSVAKGHSTLSKVADTFVTGHAMTMTSAELMEYATFMREFAEAARAAKKAGTSVEAHAKSYTIPAKFKDYTAAQEAGVRAASQVIYDETK
jgi:glyoxylase-like metal-dependent hydrolase (beta-lactamase superfamily II)